MRFFRVLRGFCHVCLYDRVTKEINRIFVFATFCESVFGIFELEVWFTLFFFVFVFVFFDIFSFGGDFLSFLFVSLFLFFSFFLSFAETEEQSS